MFPVFWLLVTAFVSGSFPAIALVAEWLVGKRLSAVDLPTDKFSTVWSIAFCFHERLFPAIWFRMDLVASAGLFAESELITERLPGKRFPVVELAKDKLAAARFPALCFPICVFPATWCHNKCVAAVGCFPDIALVVEGLARKRFPAIESGIENFVAPCFSAFGSHAGWFFSIWYCNEWE